MTERALTEHALTERDLARNVLIERGRVPAKRERALIEEIH